MHIPTLTRRCCRCHHPRACRPPAVLQEFGGQAAPKKQYPTLILKNFIIFVFIFGLLLFMTGKMSRSAVFLFLGLAAASTAVTSTSLDYCVIGAGYGAMLCCRKTQNFVMKLFFMFLSPLFPFFSSFDCKLDHCAKQQLQVAVRSCHCDFARRLCVGLKCGSCLGNESSDKPYRKREYIVITNTCRTQIPPKSGSLS